MLKLYSDKDFLTEIHRKRVFPLLFDLYFSKNDLLLKYYRLTDDVSSCDFIVFPIDYSHFIKFKDAFNNLHQLAKKLNKPVWIYTAGDYGFTNYIKNSYTFRLAGFHIKLSNAR